MQNCGPGQPVSRYMTSTILLYNGGEYLMIEFIFLMKIDICTMYFINVHCINININSFYIFGYSETPLSLQSTCRLAVRKVIGRNANRKISELGEASIMWPQYITNMHCTGQSVLTFFF